MEVFLDVRSAEQYQRLYGEDGWCEEAWVTFASPRKNGRRKYGYAPLLTHQLAASSEGGVHPQLLHHAGIVVVSFGTGTVYDPKSFPQMVLLHSRPLDPATRLRGKQGASFSFNALRAAVLSQVRYGVVLEEDMMLVNPLADSLLTRTKQEVTEAYPFPMLPVHFLDRDPANDGNKSSVYSKFTIEKSPDPLFPRPTMRWGQGQPTFSFWALPFLARWLAARLLEREEQGVHTRFLENVEELLNVALWREGAQKGWCTWQLVGLDFVTKNFLPQRDPGSFPWHADPLRFPKGVPVAFYFGWAEGDLDKYSKAREALGRHSRFGQPWPKSFFHARRFFGTFAELRAEHPDTSCLL